MLLSLASGCANALADANSSTVGVYNHRSRVGSSAREMLVDGAFRSLVVEIQPVEGVELSSETLAHFREFLEKRVNKPSGIELVVRSPIPSPGKSRLTLAEARALEDKHRRHFTAGSVLTAYVLVLDAQSNADKGESRVLGEAHRNSSIVLWGRTVKELSGGTFQPARWALEATVLEHEFAHVLGLVNDGTAAQSAHHDPANEAHCTNKQCLMNANAQGNIFSWAGDRVPELDAGCLQDLQANGGK